MDFWTFSITGKLTSEGQMAHTWDLEGEEVPTTTLIGILQIVQASLVEMQLESYRNEGDDE